MKLIYENILSNTTDEKELNQVKSELMFHQRLRIIRSFIEQCDYECIYDNTFTALFVDILYKSAKLYDELPNEFTSREFLEKIVLKVLNIETNETESVLNKTKDK